MSLSQINKSLNQKQKYSNINRHMNQIDSHKTCTVLNYLVTSIIINTDNFHSAVASGLYQAINFCE